MTQTISKDQIFETSNKNTDLRCSSSWHHQLFRLRLAYRYPRFRPTKTLPQVEIGEANLPFLPYISHVFLSSGYNLQITHLERKMIFQTSIIVFHVILPGFSLCCHTTTLSPRLAGHQLRPIEVIIIAIITFVISRGVASVETKSCWGQP